MRTSVPAVRMSVRKETPAASVICKCQLEQQKDRPPPFLSCRRLILQKYRPWHHQVACMAKRACFHWYGGTCAMTNLLRLFG